MMEKKLVSLTAGILLTFSAFSYSDIQNIALAKTPKTVIKYNRTDEQKAKKIEKENTKTESRIKILDKKIAKLRQQLKNYSSAHTVESVSKAKLASLNYNGQNIITVNNNDPSFSKSDLSTSNGAWQRYGNLDDLNRVTSANALLNESLMPNSPREALHVDPTGWHNKRIPRG